MLSTFGKMKISIFVILKLFFYVNSDAMNILRDRQVAFEGTELSFSDINTLPLPNTEVYWLINQTNPGVLFNFALQASNYSYLVSTIEIQIFTGENNDCVQESTVDVGQYLVRYKVKSETRQMRLGSYPVTTNGELISVTVNPFPADSIEILRNLDTAGQYCMRYGLLGTEIAQISVLSYDLSAPNLAKDSEYSGLCNDVRCFGGKGRLTDGSRGTLNDLPNTGVAWRCPMDRIDGCAFILNFKFSSFANISRLQIIGFSGTGFLIPTITVQNSIDGPSIASIPAPRQFVDQDKSLFIQPVSLESDTDELVIIMSVQSSADILLTEVEIVTNEGVNIGTRDLGYTFSGINQSELIAPEPTNTPSPQSQPTTTPTLQQNSTTLSTMTISSNSTMPPEDKGESEFISRSDFITITGILVLFIIMLILNSAIVIVWLAKSKQATKKMLKKVQKPRNENEHYFHHARRPTDVTVLENISHRYGHGIYDSLSPPQVAYNVEHTQTHQNVNSSISNGSQVTDVPISSLHSSSQMEISVPIKTSDSHVPVQNGVMMSSIAKPEIACDDIYQVPTHNLPEIVIDCPQTSINSSLKPNIPPINIQGFHEVPKDDDELSIQMEDNVAYKSPNRTNSTSSMDDELGVPMTFNIGYVTSNSLCPPSQPEYCDIKHIYSSIKERPFCIPLPERGAGDFSSYNILMHK